MQQGRNWKTILVENIWIIKCKICSQTDSGEYKICIYINPLICIWLSGKRL